MADISIARLKALAGITDRESGAFVILPEGTDAEEMRAIVNKLKAILDDRTNWHQLDINGEPYIATGVKRDL